MSTPAGNGDTVPPVPPIKWHIGDLVLKLMDQAEPRITQTDLANKTGLSRNTIGDLVHKNVDSGKGTIEAIADYFKTSRNALEQEVARLNGEGNVISITRRDQKERAEDRDPELDEAVQYGKRIARLPRIARLAIFNTIQAFEDAFSLVKSKLS